MDTAERNRIIIQLVAVALFLISIRTLYIYIQSTVNLISLVKLVSNEKDMLFYQATKAKSLPFYAVYCLWAIFLGASAISLFNFKKIGAKGCSLALTIFVLYNFATIFYDPVGISTYLLIIGNLSKIPLIDFGRAAYTLFQKAIPIILGILGIVIIHRIHGSGLNSKTSQH